MRRDVLIEEATRQIDRLRDYADEWRDACLEVRSEDGTEQEHIGAVHQIDQLTGHLEHSADIIERLIARLKGLKGEPLHAP